MFTTAIDVNKRKVEGNILAEIARHRPRTTQTLSLVFGGEVETGDEATRRRTFDGEGTLVLPNTTTSAFYRKKYMGYFLHGNLL